MIPDHNTTPWRMPWTRGSEQFQRHWLVCGPLTPDQAAAVLDPSIDYDAPAAIPPWTPLTSWSDDINLEGMVPIDPDQVALARTTVARAGAGPATLLIGADGPLEVFVNGVSVHHRPKPEPFAFDQTAVPVTLREGDNEFILQLVNASGPIKVSFRIVEPGAIVTRTGEIGPTLLDEADGRLTLRTDIFKDDTRAPVEIDVIVPGGTVIAHTAAPRGETVQLEYVNWPSGPVEIRCTTLNGAGDRRAAHLSWYHGDALADARELIAAAAKEPPGPEGDHVRMLADLVQDFIDHQLARIDPAARRLLNSALFEFREFLVDRAGGNGAIRPWGFVRMAWTDDTDGSTQFCRAYLPPEYDPTKAWPVVIFLHGYHPANPPYIGWWSIDMRHTPEADNSGVIYLEPHGRGNSSFAGIGDKDVLRALAEARHLFTIDDDRVYLTGESMGGDGVWSMASRHPDLFAAAAPVHGGWDPRLVPVEEGGLAGRLPASELERFQIEVGGSFGSVENLLHVPLAVHHGDADPAVDVGNSRFIVQMLQRWGFDVRYFEHVGLGHENLGARESIVEWLLTHRRVKNPSAVRLRSPDLDAARAYWLSVEAAEHPCELIEVDAAFTQPGVLRLDTVNAAAVHLNPPATLCAGDTLTVVWNGNRQTTRLTNGGVRIGTPLPPAGSLAKIRGMEGGIERFITTPFIVVVGTTSPDAAMRQACHDKAEVVVTNWTTWQKHPPRVRLDHELTAEEERSHSLLLIGGPEANSIARKFAAKIPLQIAPDRITIDGRSWTVSDAVVQLLYPSPAAPDRYVLEVAGTSPKGLYFWAPLLWDDRPIIHDWSIADGRLVTLPPSHPSEEARVATGVFDQAWRRDDRWVVEGDAERRAASPLRRGPAQDSGPASLEMTSWVGTYQLEWDQLVVTETEGGLRIQSEGGQPTRLIRESANEFGDPLTGAFLRFVTGADGSVTLYRNLDGQAKSSLRAAR